MINRKKTKNNKIPFYPKFKILSLKDKNEIDRITQREIPYSDYNFASLWSYNILGDIQVSLLYDNLVVKYRDYVTDEPFYSFFGKKKINTVINILLERAKKENIMPVLKLIPEFSISSLTISSKYFLQEDRDNFDYLYDLKELSELKGSKYEKKRNLVNKFTKSYSDVNLTLVDLKNSKVKKEIINTFKTWAKRKKKKRKQIEHELIAIKKLIKSYKIFNLLCIAIYHKNLMRGFAIVELSNQKYAICHFVKADIDYKGIFACLYKKTAEFLVQRNYKYLNREQDLGIITLRSAKTEWRPMKYLKKYSISKKTI